MSLRIQSFITQQHSLAFVQLLVTIFILTCANINYAETFSSPVISKTVVVDGVAYPLSLRLNPSFHDKITNDSATQHYIGYADQHHGSWVRLSYLANQWQGVFSIYGELHTITPANSIINSNGDIIVSNITADKSPPLQCGASSTMTDILTKPAQKIVLDQTIDYATLCTNTINNVCIVAELELAFDQAFQQRYPDNAEDQANSLINIVEGYYVNDLNIGFSKITSEFLSTDIFSTSTDSITLLGDIQSKKANQQLPFIKNNAALLHLITGREFDGSTVGVAYLGALCDTNGFSAGTSQVVASNIPLTALVVAHEIGHNMGSDHDDPENNSCASGFIMAPSLSGNASQFSSCSTTAIQSAISNTNNIEQCINFAADVSLNANENNTKTAAQGVTITDEFEVNVSALHQPITDLNITGSIINAAGSTTPADSQFTQVSLTGANCTIADDQFSYQCTLNLPAGTSTLSISTQTGSIDFDISHSVIISNPSTVIDINSTNNSLQQQVSVSGTTPTTETESDADSDTSTDTGTDTDTSGTPETPETSNSSETTAPSVDSGGGGGGGSFSIGILTALFLSVLTRINAGISNSLLTYSNDTYNLKGLPARFNNGLDYRQHYATIRIRRFSTKTAHDSQSPIFRA